MERVVASVSAGKVDVMDQLWALVNQRRTVKEKEKQRGNGEGVMPGGRASPLGSPVILPDHSLMPSTVSTEQHGERPLVAYLPRPDGDMDPHLFRGLGSYALLC